MKEDGLLVLGIEWGSCLVFSLLFAGVIGIAIRVGLEVLWAVGDAVARIIH